MTNNDRSLEIALHEEARLTGNKNRVASSDKREFAILTSTQPVTYEETLQAISSMGYEPASLEDLLEFMGSEEILEEPPIAMVAQPDGSKAELRKPSQ